MVGGEECRRARSRFRQEGAEFGEVGKCEQEGKGGMRKCHLATIAVCWLSVRIRSFYVYLTTLAVGWSLVSRSLISLCGFCSQHTCS